MQERCVHSGLYLERVLDEYELDWGKQRANKTNEDRGGQVESWPRNAKSRTWRGWSMWGPGRQPPQKLPKVSELSLPVHCEVDLINGGH